MLVPHARPRLYILLFSEVGVTTNSNRRNTEATNSNIFKAIFYIDLYNNMGRGLKGLLYLHLFESGVKIIYCMTLNRILHN